MRCSPVYNIEGTNPQSSAMAAASGPTPLPTPPNSNKLQLHDQFPDQDQDALVQESSSSYARKERAQSPSDFLLRQRRGNESTPISPESQLLGAQLSERFSPEHEETASGGYTTHPQSPQVANAQHQSKRQRVAQSPYPRETLSATPTHSAQTRTQDHGSQESVHRESTLQVPELVRQQPGLLSYSPSFNSQNQPSPPSIEDVEVISSVFSRMTTKFIDYGREMWFTQRHDPTTNTWLQPIAPVHLGSTVSSTTEDRSKKRKRAATTNSQAEERTENNTPQRTNQNNAQLQADQNNTLQRPRQTNAPRRQSQNNTPQQPRQNNASQQPSQTNNARAPKKKATTPNTERKPDTKSTRNPANKPLVSKNYLDWPDYSPTKDCGHVDAEKCAKNIPQMSGSKDLSEDPLKHELSAAELIAAQRCGMDCARYLCTKRSVFVGYVKHLRYKAGKYQLTADDAKKGLKSWNKTAAQGCSGIDVNKTSALWQYFWQPLGWFDESKFQDVVQARDVYFPTFDKEGRLVSQ